MIEAFLKTLPTNQEYLVFQDGKPLYERLEPGHWQKRRDNSFSLVAPHSNLLCIHQGTGPFSLELQEHTTLHFCEWFQNTGTTTSEYLLKPHAHLEHSLLDSTLPNLWQQRISQVRLTKNSTMNSHLLLQGTVHNDYRTTVQLTASGAEFTLNASMLLPPQTQLEVFTDVQHLHPHTKSQQSFRAIVQGTAKSVVTGHILVAPHAIDSEAQLNHKALLLKEQAIARVRPELEIYADAVKCAHGASVSQLEPESLFFLQSRGLTKETATHLLLEGFLLQTMPSFALPTFNQRANKQVQTLIGDAAC